MPDVKLIPRSEAKAPFFAGVDLGGTNIKLGIVDDEGRPLVHSRIPTETERGPEDACQRMAHGLGEAMARIGLTSGDVVRVGLGTPGTMDVPAGMLLSPHNLPGWNNFPIRDRLSHYCGLPVTFANDANAAAYGEFWVGSGRQWHSMVFFTLGTGVGCGIVIGDLIIDGENSAGAECGHIIIDSREDARVCPCGKLGHLEAYASATAVVKRAQERLDAGHKSSVSAHLERGEELTPLLLAKEAEAGDQFSIEIVMETARYFGIGVATLMYTIDPNGVAIGGAMTFGGHDAELGRQFLARIKEEVRQRAFPVPAERTVIDFAQLGGDAGYIGAAGMARLDYQK